MERFFFRSTALNERASAREPALAAAEAVKAYIRMNRARLAEDGELLALLLPSALNWGEVRDLQRFTIERLKDANADLRRERDALRATRDDAARLSDGVKKAVLELLDARRFEEAIEAATDAAAAFGADRAALCVEAVPGAAPVGSDGVRLIAPGTAAAILGGDGLGAILGGGGEILFGRARRRLSERSRVPPAHRARYARRALRLGRARSRALRRRPRPPTISPSCARALERAIRAWLDLPKL